jgi:DNA modification methylase
MSATLYCGDVRAVLATLPERSVQTVVTSPPYWGLRDYGQTGQLGLERTPEEYVANMVAVFREVRRILRDDGTLWLNLGDSYAGSWGNQGRKEERGTQRPINSGMLTPVHDGRYPSLASNTGKIPEGSGLKPKDLVGIPWSVAFALRADGWYLRSEIIWQKPNPMPESVTDRPTKAHEQVFLLSKSPTYYYDAAAIAEPASENKPWAASSNGGAKALETRNDGGNTYTLGKPADGTRNARSVWSIATQPYAGAHFATFPEELARRCILAGSAAKACETCGAPWERQLERTPMVLKRSERTHSMGHTRSSGTMLEPPTATTIGWAPGCVCSPNTGAASSVVLDPFGGSGTVAAVAVGHGRRAIHIDLNPAYIHLARERIGPMLCTDAPVSIPA